MFAELGGQNPSEGNASDDARHTGVYLGRQASRVCGEGLVLGGIRPFRSAEVWKREALWREDLAGCS